MPTRKMFGGLVGELVPLGYREGWLRDFTVLDLISAQAQRRPHATAVCDADGAYSYGELLARTKVVTGTLAAAFVERQDVVGVMMPRGRSWAATLLGLWWLGAIYLPIDSSTPPARAAAIVRRSKLKRLVAHPDCALAARAACEGTAAEVVVIDAVIAPHTSPSDPVRAAPGDLAYVIFTSGSTGEPKGAMVEHRGLLNHTLAKMEDLVLTARDQVAHLAPLSFDISVWQLIAPLAAGATCHIAAGETAHDPWMLAAFLRDRSISVAQVVPSLLRAALGAGAGFRGQAQDPTPLRILSLTGEAAPPRLCHDWLARYPSVALLNAYGPTECSDDVTHFLFSEPGLLGATSTPIGAAIRNAELFVMVLQDGEWRPTIIGEIGELFVSGPCVGPGYLNDPVRTAEAFNEVNGARIYRTGDLVRVRPDDLLEFCGRRDRQVKVRGHRIELGEIEAVLEASGLIQQAVADLTPPSGATRETLCVYLVAPDDGFDLAAVRRTAAERLPAYMCPDVYVRLDRVPVSANGKTDLAALRALSQSAERALEMIANEGADDV